MIAKFKSALVLVLVLSLISPCVSCGDNEDTSPITTTSQESESETTSDEYSYPDVDFEGYEFKILNYSDMWGCYMDIDLDEQSGERLDDAVYNRNRMVEDKLGFEIAETKFAYPGWSEITQIIDMYTNSIMADDGIYDCAYIPVSFKPAIITEGYLYDMNSIPELHLDQPWWDKSINDAMTINGKLYTASSPLHLMSFDMSWVLLFNQDMMDDLKLEYPYQLVRDGDWTLDKFYEYLTKAASLNGDSSFTYSPDGSAVYGLAVHHDSIRGMIFASDNEMIIKNNSGYNVNIETERLYTTLDKLLPIYSTADGISNGSSDGTQNNYYMTMFRNNRSLFVTCELMSSLSIRDMEDTFGLLPFPKLDENQENYRTEVNSSSCLLTLPATLDNPSRAGIILEALTYESYANVLPAYYDITLSQKGLRNEESIEMLNIVRDTRDIDFALMFGLTTDLSNALKSMITAGQNNAASIIAEQSTVVQNNLDKLIETLNQ